ncbi:hypothetical protein [Aureispira sp. CCB-E]|uniref:hypothetical protein n=1 Tax=Aureispira sp. CCB-E TaxID=3051121 RepID=UPI0028689772|nr:hypothetical protein [Aureispira sp. CCB-E]WMX16300.1 hypothetical protein QP953_07975 [Aureispira sp. CCB-E]
MKVETMKFGLRKINTIEFATTIEPTVSEHEKMELKANIMLGINENLRFIITSIKFQFEIDNSPFIILNMSCEFEIEEDVWNQSIDKEGSSISFPRNFLLHLVATTVGTARGILYTKTEHTPFNKYLLPMLNINELVKEDQVFQLKN